MGKGIAANIKLTQPGGYGTEPATGDLVPKGTYYCENCGKPYEHKDEKQPLPFCPGCGIWTLYRTSKP